MALTRDAAFAIVVPDLNAIAWEYAESSPQIIHRIRHSCMFFAAIQGKLTIVGQLLLEAVATLLLNGVAKGNSQKAVIAADLAERKC